MHTISDPSKVRFVSVLNSSCPVKSAEPYARTIDESTRDLVRSARALLQSLSDRFQIPSPYRRWHRDSRQYQRDASSEKYCRRSIRMSKK